MTENVVSIKYKPSRRTNAATKKRSTDWNAVERDYRTAKFTLRELQAKHGPSYSLIARNAKKHRWSQDLSIAIKQANHAKLVNALVSTEVNKSAQQVHATV